MNRAGILPGMFAVNETGDYVNEMLQGSWLVWQAAEAQAVRACVEICKAAPFEWVDGKYGKLPIDGRDTCVAAIRAAFPHVKE